MYLTIFVLLFVCGDLAVICSSSRAVSPPLQLVALTARRPGVETLGEIEHHRNGLARYLAPEGVGSKRLRAWRPKSWPLVRRLFSRCLRRYKEANSLDELHSSVLWSIKAVQVKLRIFRESPVVYLLLLGEVTNFVTRLCRLLDKRAKEILALEDAGILRASPRLDAQYKARLKNIDSMYDDIARLVEYLAVAVDVLPFEKVSSSRERLSNYWSRVHIMAYKSGIAMMVISWGLVFLNRVILPYLLRELLSLVSKHAQTLGRWIPSDFVTLTLE